MSGPPDFDLIARPYRWLEYLTLGRGLERCRLHFLPQLAGRTHALVVGDGDGRFLARLLAADHGLTADAVDTSTAMLTLLRHRCAFASSRLRTYHADAIALATDLPSPARQYDLVVTHFFLDCLTQPQLDTLAAAIVPGLAPNALWLVSDFHVPAGAMRLPAHVFVRALYLAFRVLTGLRPTRLPDHVAALTHVGLIQIARSYSLFGLLTTELWSNSTSPSVRIET